MLQPPDIDHREIAAILRAAYGVTVSDIVFLPVGADPDAAAWRVTVSGGSPLFLKTRFGPFDPAGLAVPRFLKDAGIAEVLAPLPTRDGALSVAVGATTLVLYPFVEGRNGFEVVLTAEDWTALGTAMRRIHETALPGRSRRSDRRRTIRAAMARERLPLHGRSEKRPGRRRGRRSRRPAR